MTGKDRTVQFLFVEEFSGTKVKKKKTHRFKTEIHCSTAQLRI